MISYVFISGTQNKKEIMTTMETIVNPINSRNKLDELAKEIFNILTLSIGITTQIKDKFYAIDLDRNVKKDRLIKELERKLKTLPLEEQKKIQGEIKAFLSKL